MSGSNERPPISAYIRTLNEEKLIEAVVEAAFQVAREVVIVDSGSTDQTVQLAKRAGAKVFHHEWTGSGRQKRFAEDQCTHDWLLDIDADEIVTSALAANIQQQFRSGEPETDMYELAVALIPPIGRPWLRFGHAHRIKLYNRQIVRAPDHIAWDQFRVPAGAKVSQLRDTPLHHYSFRNTEHLLGKINANSSIRAHHTKMKPRWQLILRILFGWPIYFAKTYGLKGLFRGGIYGFVYSIISAQGRWLRDVKMYERLQGLGPSGREDFDPGLDLPTSRNTAEPFKEEKK